MRKMLCAVLLALTASWSLVANADDGAKRRHPQPGGSGTGAATRNHDGEKRPKREKESRPRRRNEDRERRHAVPRDPDGRDDARDRHPRPDPDHQYRERRFRHRDYQDFWSHEGRDHRSHYWFPRHYRTPWHRGYRYHGYRFGPHVRFWCPEISIWFYWPFEDEPADGCGWYWVPTYRFLEWTPYGYHYRYWGWEHVYLCFDGDRVGDY